MYSVFHLYKNNNLFKAGFLIGSGFAFMLSGSIFVMTGGYSIIKYGFQK
jgi:hypothetical protein